MAKLNSIVPNICANGVTYQWFADTTEHAHPTVIKDPGQAGNNQGYDAQICWGLDHIDKVQQFDLATSICEAGIDFRKGDEGWNNKEGVTFDRKIKRST